MAKDTEFTGAEKDLMVKLLGGKAAALAKLAEKSDGSGDKKIAAAARSQKAEVDTLLNKIL